MNSKFSEISVILFYVLISFLGFVYLVLMVSFRKGFFVFKRLFVVDPMKNRFEFFQLSQRQKNNCEKINSDYRGNKANLISRVFNAVLQFSLGLNNV